MFDGKSVTGGSDIKVQSAAGLFEFARTFTSSPLDWARGKSVSYTAALRDTPKPFGSAAESADSMKWSHNFYSFVYENLSPTFGPAALWVRTVEGGTFGFQARSDVGFAAPLAESAGAAYILRVDSMASGAKAFSLIAPDGTRYVYDRLWRNTARGDKYFLSAVKSPKGESLAELEYGVPTVSGYTCPNCLEGVDAGTNPPPSCADGVPYISRIEASNGTSIRFEYGTEFARGECFIKKLVASRSGSPDITLAEYAYDSQGLIGSVSLPDAGVVASYSYADGGLTISTPEREVVHQFDGEGRVSSAVEGPLGGPPEASYTFEWASRSVYNSAMADRYPGLALLAAYEAELNASTSTQYVAEVSYSCGNPLLCAQGTEATVMGAVVGIAYEKAFKDRGDAYRVQVKSASTAGADLPQLLELTSVYEGATDADGTGALSTEGRTYVYGSVTGRQLLATVTRPSPMAGEGAAAEWTERLSYDEMDRLVSRISSGYTKTFDASTSALVSRSVGTFYEWGRTTAVGSCEADHGGSTNPEAQWVLHVTGPCEVAGPTATGCAGASGTYPITEYVFGSYPGGSTNGQLKKVLKFPAGCGSTPLVTTYTDYDAFGNLLAEQDPNGVVTTYVYDGPQHLLKSKTIGEGTQAATWQYEYEKQKLIKTTYPEGNVERFCYRAGADSLCSGGTWTNRLHWKARYDASQAIMEKVAYEYWGDGATKSESYIDAAGAVRVRKYYKPDVDGRPVYEKTGGDLAVAPSERHRAFDARNNPFVQGSSYNGAPEFCHDSSGAPSGRCSRSQFDRLSRLVGSTTYETLASTAPSRQCIWYDVAGNPNKIISGCRTARPCEDPAILTECPADAYLYDDFGNLVQATLASSGVTGGGADPIWYEYDAVGNQTKRQGGEGRAQPTPWWYATTYDALGRKLAMKKATATTEVVLYQYEYDADGDPARVGDCLGTSRRLKGRLARVVEPTGSRHYGYDLAGRVTGEVFSPPGGVCALASFGRADGASLTSYSYDRNGTLLEMRQPSGRRVRYEYQAGNAWRVGSVGLVNEWNGTAWATRTAPLVVLKSAQWEPYSGQLREYRAVTPEAPGTGTDQEFRVEYLAGTTAASLGSGDLLDGSSACLASARPAGTPDGTGRLRAIWVSRGATTAGDLLKVQYAWKGEQVVSEDLCLLGAAKPKRTSYLYDQMERVVGATTSGFAVTGGEGLPQFQYDHQATPQASRLASRWDERSAHRFSYEYDREGRVTRKNLANDSTGTPAGYIRFDYGQSSTSHSAGDVFVGAEVNGFQYGYFYDAFNRRTKKLFPLFEPGAFELYAHDQDNHLIADDGMGETAISAAERSRDEYLWLGDRPVALIRLRYGETVPAGWPGQGSCLRREDLASEGQGDDCGLYHLITDRMGKLLMALDSQQRLAGAWDYQAFGHVNRVDVSGETAHPHAGGEQELASIALPLGGTRVWMRSRYHYVDAETGAVGLRDGSGQSLEEGVTGAHAGAQVGRWVSPTDGHGRVVFSGTGSTVRFGAVLDSVEYARASADVSSPLHVRLRFPGQYYDPETDLFENWHRYYDPSIGRYLQPEPMIQKPMYMKLLAGQGRSLQAYAYARNNPVRFGDATGQELEGDKDSCSPEAQKVIKKLRDKIKKGLPAGKCKKLLDDVGIIDLVDSDTVYTIICTKEEKLPNCDGSGESTTPDACGAADAENRCATVREKGSKLGCPGIEETVLHETAHLCGPWPVGTPHVEGDDALYKRIERCAVEIAGSR